MTGPYVRRSTRVLRVLLLLACVLLGTVIMIGGLTIVFLLRATFVGLVVAVAGVGLMALAFRQRNRWHMTQQRLQW